MTSSELAEQLKPLVEPDCPQPPAPQGWESVWKPEWRRWVYSPVSTIKEDPLEKLTKLKRD